MVQFVVWVLGGCHYFKQLESATLHHRAVKQSFKMFFSNDVKLQEGRAPNLIIVTQSSSVYFSLRCLNIKDAITKA